MSAAQSFLSNAVSKHISAGNLRRPTKPSATSEGDRTKDKTIFCNDRSFSITSSLEHAPRRLHADWPRTLWLDQVCVNQDGPKERSHQVALMRGIYGGAETVSHFQDSDLFFDPREEVNGMQWLPMDAKLAKLGLLPKSSPEWKQPGFMPSLPYFERICVLQEVYAAREVIFLWGETEIP
ncbi:hypothetical protein VTI74DRAFT_9961 [Chaetomium olivicolor]